MRHILRFAVLLTVKCLSRIFYRTDMRWVGQKPKRLAKDLRLFVLLNHTSLYEPLHLAKTPLSVLWQIARRGTFPGADITLNRPLVGRFFKVLAPNVVTITRRRDASWDNYLSSIDQDSLILIAPEGRMKRPSGLDKNGEPMTVRGGIADLLMNIDSGRMLIAYSGGLHHVQSPGQSIPRLFQRLRVAFEAIDIGAYRLSLGQFDLKDPEGQRAFKRAVMSDLEHRRDRECALLERPKRKLAAS